MLGINKGDKILYCAAMSHDDSQGVAITGTVFDVNEKAYGFTCEECLLDDTANRFYKHLCDVKGNTYGSKNYCFKMNQNFQKEKEEFLAKALDIALITYASTSACDVCEGECNSQCVEEIKSGIISQAKKLLRENKNGK